ncbi:DUF1330 domain-containing protein [Pseudoalteromonas sp. MMG005]|uniref:DUF1330 domain-containing protein n=1 Tax=Pseudoalteromonas sp. MMG005 TaxID=2822682 RepID=UPI001B3A7958|nr:DUF1330 domain-containing protein [Pseudoalteromonas sp. MMG005]MBQ4845758.1 DUF1330 domain-containing protein [Pseudoalteromonas sp. MMG005]
MFEILVGLHVTHASMYKDYRAAMTPILREYGGSFSTDFIVEETLMGPSNKINRVFTLRFSNESDKTCFFKDEHYQNVKNQYFNDSVSEVYILSEYSC